MIIVLKRNPTDEQVAEAEAHVRELGYEPHTIRGVVRTIVAAVGDETTHTHLDAMQNFDYVDRVLPIQNRYKLISRETYENPLVVNIGSTQIGAGAFHIIGGPCAIESYEQLHASCKGALDHGAHFIRAGAYKPRTSPYDFQGLGKAGLELLSKLKQELNCCIVSECVSESDIPDMDRVVDVFQIGTRNALNYALLQAAARTGKTVLLKRGMSATIEEWLLAAEYIVKAGNPNVILCERGIRTFETATRNTLDVSAIAIAKQETNLPVFVDPSHAAGRRDLIPALAKAGIAAGADGMLVEVHHDPSAALSDSAQQLTPEAFSQLISEIRPFIKAAGKQLT